MCDELSAGQEIGVPCHHMNPDEPDWMDYEEMDDNASEGEQK
jgi:hypothetical protein